MRAIKFYETYQKKHDNNPTEGFFLEFGTNYEELNQGVGVYTVAIVQDHSGNVYEIPPTHMVFHQDQGQPRMS